jgi:hypothetical protein
MTSIYHNTESDWDILKTYHSLKDEWCKETPTKVQWVKGHADKENRELTRDELLNIEADLLADKIREEKATLFIQGTKGTIGMKQQLPSQLSDAKLKDYIIEK